MPTPVFYILAALFFVAAIVVQMVRGRRDEQRQAERSFTGQASDVVSLDEDSDAQPQEDSGPSKIPQMLLMTGGLVAILLALYIEPSVHEHGLKVTYEELGIIKMCEFVATQFDGQAAKAVLVITPNLARELTHPHLRFATDALKDKVELVDMEISQMRSIRAGNLPAPLHATKFKEIQTLYPRINVVVSLADLAADIDTANWPQRQRRPYLAVLAPRPELYRYLDLVEQGFVDLVVIPRGFFPANAMIPQQRAPDQLRDDHFIFLNINNVRAFRDGFGQLIVPLPVNPENFPL